ncbi:MAG: MotA/TolQ/ExbB proton channel family protein [Acidobacteriota bacterium]
MDPNMALETMDPKNVDLKTSVLELMHQGGPVMWALLVFSIVALGSFFERAWVLRRARTDMKAYLTALTRTLLEKRSVSEAMKVSASTPGPAPRVALAGLRHFESSTSHLEKSIERRAQGEVRRLHRGLGILATTAVTAPLLGFLGTVTGMISSFDILSDFGTSNPGMVAHGIKEALTTTAAGLTIAVPTQIAHNVLSSRVERIVGDIEEVANFLLEARETSS